MGRNRGLQKTGVPAKVLNHLEATGVPMSTLELHALIGGNYDTVERACHRLKYDDYVIMDPDPDENGSIVEITDAGLEWVYDGITVD